MDNWGYYPTYKTWFSVVEAVEDLRSASVCSKGAASEMGRQGGNDRFFLSSLVSSWIHLDPFSGRMDMSQKKIVQDHSLRQKLKGNGVHHHHPHKGENKKDNM